MSSLEHSEQSHFDQRWNAAKPVEVSVRAPTLWTNLPQAVQPGQKVIAVGGGKGGIGKSLISANLGVHLASRGSGGFG